MHLVNPWHHVSCGPDAPAIVQSIIEIPKGSKAQYELDKASGLLRLDRVLFSSVQYPANYGFIPQTYCGDGDPLDILVLSQIDLVPLCIVEAKVIGVMQMLDQNQPDDKIIAVAAQDMSVAHMDDITALPAHMLLELRGFFEDYKRLEQKTVVVDQFQGHMAAQAIVQESIAFYQHTFRGRLPSCL